MADGHVAGQRVEVALLEDAGDQAEVLGDRDRLVVADSNTGRLLAAVLQRVQPEVRQTGDVLAGCVDAKNSAGFLGVLGPIVQEHFFGKVSCHTE